MLKNDYISELRAILIDRRKALVAHNRMSWDKIEKNEKDDAANVENILAELSKLDERRWNEILQIDTALEKIEEGICRMCKSCEKFIGTSRLRVLPHAHMCLQCVQFSKALGRREQLPDREDKLADR